MAVAAIRAQPIIPHCTVWSLFIFSSYETTLKNFVGFAKNSEFVMPDLIRHPEFADVTGFRPSPE
jgi:hypothetical protein